MFVYLNRQIHGPQIRLLFSDMNCVHVGSGSNSNMVNSSKIYDDLSHTFLNSRQYLISENTKFN